MNYEIAEDDELPHHFLAKFWNQPVGLLITAIATLILVNSLNIESISTAGSIGFIFIFGIVNFVGFKLAKEMGSNQIVPMIGSILCAIALVVLIKQQLNENLTGILVSIGIIVSCFLIEWIYKKKEAKKQ